VGPSEHDIAQRHWSTFATAWQRLQPPLRPTTEVVGAMRAAIGERRGRIIELGVTRELASVSPAITAVDWNAMMIAEVWRRDGNSRPVVRANWLEMPFADSSFVAALGDGSLNALQYPLNYLKVCAELSRILRPGGRAVFRTYCAPAEAEPISALHDDLGANKILNFHAFKWRLAMGLVGLSGQPNIKVQDILRVFDDEFPHREALANLTGWPRADIDMIDIYRDSSEVYSFPTLDQFQQVLRDCFVQVEVLEVGGYPLAERCPLLLLSHGD